MKKFTLLISILVGLSLLAGCGASSSETDSAEEQSSKVFYIGGIPDQSKSDLDNAMNALASILAEETGLDVQYREVADYAAVVSGFARDEIQLAWFGGLTGVQGRALLEDSVAVLHREEDTGFTSVFIAGVDTGIESLQDIKGHNFTFGSESSTSGHLMPRYFLVQAGLTPEDDFVGEVGYSGSHDRTIELVTNGAYDAGALNDIVWERYVNEGLVDLERVKLLEYSPPYFNYNFSMPSKASIDAAYGAGTFDKVVDALMAIDVSSNDALYAFFVSEGFIPTNNENYDDLKVVAEMLGLLIP